MRKAKGMAAIFAGLLLMFRAGAITVSADEGNHNKGNQTPLPKVASQNSNSNKNVQQQNDDKNKNLQQNVKAGTDALTGPNIMQPRPLDFLTVTDHSE